MHNMVQLNENKKNIMKWRSSFRKIIILEIAMMQKHRGSYGANTIGSEIAADSELYLPLGIFLES